MPKYQSDKLDDTLSIFVVCTPVSNNIKQTVNEGLFEKSDIGFFSINDERVAVNINLLKDIVGETIVFNVTKFLQEQDLCTCVIGVNKDLKGCAIIVIEEKIDHFKVQLFGYKVSSNQITEITTHAINCNARNELDSLIYTELRITLSAIDADSGYDHLKQLPF